MVKPITTATAGLRTKIHKGTMKHDSKALDKLRGRKYIHSFKKSKKNPRDISGGAPDELATGRT
jgi:hypothetical protein